MVRQRPGNMAFANQTSSPSIVQRCVSMKSILIACFGLALCILLTVNGSNRSENNNKTIISKENEVAGNDIAQNNDSYAETVEQSNNEDIKDENEQEFSSTQSQTIPDSQDEQDARIEAEEMNADLIEEENRTEQEEETEEVEEEENAELIQELEEEEAEVAEEQAEFEVATNESMTDNEDELDGQPRTEYSRSRYSDKKQSYDEDEAEADNSSNGDYEDEQTQSHISAGSDISEESSRIRASPKQYDRFSSRYGSKQNKYESNMEEQDTVEDSTVPSISSLRGQSKSSYGDGMTNKFSEDEDISLENNDVDGHQEVDNLENEEANSDEEEGEDVTLPNSSNERVVIKPIADEEVQDAVEETADDLQTTQQEAVKDESETMMGYVGKSVNALVRHGLLMLTHSNAEEELLTDKEKDKIVEDVQEQVELTEQTNDVASEIIETISNKAAQEVEQGESPSDISNTIEMEDEEGNIQIEDEVSDVASSLIKSPETMDEIKQRSFFAEKVAVEKVLSRKFRNHAKVAVDSESGAVQLTSMSRSSPDTEGEEESNYSAESVPDKVDDQPQRSSHLRKHKQKVTSGIKTLGMDDESEMRANQSSDTEYGASHQEEGYETEERNGSDNDIDGTEEREEEKEAKEAYEQDQEEAFEQEQDVEREAEDINDGPISLPTVSMLTRGRGSNHNSISNYEESTAEDMESLPSLSSLTSQKERSRNFYDSDQDSEDP
jgi:pilus assembly protein FimV